MCICMCVCVCMNMYVYMYEYVCMHEYLCMYECIYVIFRANMSQFSATWNIPATYVQDMYRPGARYSMIDLAIQYTCTSIPGTFNNYLMTLCSTHM